SITGRRAFWQFDRYRPGDSTGAVRIIYGSSQDAQLAPHGPGRACTLFEISTATLRRDLGHRAAFEEIRQRQHGIFETLLSRNFRTPLDQVIVKYVGHEDLSGITRAASTPSGTEPFREHDLSLRAFCRSS